MEKPEKAEEKENPLKQVEETTRYLNGLCSIIASEYGANGRGVAQHCRMSTKEPGPKSTQW